MIPAPPHEWEAFYAKHLPGGFRKLNDKQAEARCPWHDDKVASLSINLTEGLWKCHGCGEGGNGITFADQKGIPREFLPGWEQRQTVPAISAIYDYRDEKGNTLFQTVRYARKDFRQRRPNENGGWVWELNGVRRVLYRLPDLLAAKRTEASLFIVEGEKDVETLCKHSILATCNPMGAGKWREEYTEALQGFLEVIIIADKDEPGRKHAQQVAASVSKVVSRVKVLELPGDRVKDTTDYFQAGGDPKGLMDLVQAAKPWEPKDALHSSAPPQGIGGEPRGRNERIYFNPMPSQQFIAQKEPERDWIWGKFIPAGGLVMLCGDPKAGKTTLAYHLAKSIGKGEPFLGFKTKSCPVLILAVEEHRLDVQNRIDALGMVRPELIVHSGPLKSSPDELEAIKKHILEKKIGLVIIDVLSRFWLVGNENDASDVGKNMGPILDLARTTDAAILLLHHLRKSPGEKGRNIRGSGDLFAVVDAAITFQHTGAETQRVLETFSRFDGVPNKLIISLDNGHYTALGSPHQVDLSDQKSKILSVMTQEPTEVKVIAARIDGMAESTAREVLQKLEGAGVIIKTGEGVRNKPYLYSLRANNPPDFSAPDQSPSSAESSSSNGDNRKAPVHPNVAAVQEVFGGMVRP